MLARLKALFSAKRPSPEVDIVAAEPAPDNTLVVIPDLHGSLDLLESGLSRIKERLGGAPDTAILVFLGDYIDRGEASAQVLERVFEMQRAAPDTTICLMGNHEKMMLDFIDAPAERGPRWLRNGGLQTLASFRIGGVREGSSAEDMQQARDKLVAAMPAGLIDWLRALPLIYQSGNINCVHAAVDPNTAPQEQSEKTMLWGHKDFLRVSRRDKQLVVHGHTVVERAGLRGTNISLDTGAYHTGVLSIGVISEGKIEVL